MTDERRLVDIAPLLKSLRKEAEDYYGEQPCEPMTMDEAVEAEIDDLEELPVIDPASLRPSARWIIVRRMADGAKCQCEHCGREETFTTFDPHTEHAFCCRCGYKMEGFCNG